MTLKLHNQKFGRLTVIDRNPVNYKQNNTRWNCVCDCGNKVTVIGNNLTGGNVTSCGCISKENAYKMGKSNTTHDMAYTQTYKAWNNLVQRCINKNASNYKYYGGKGIKVCDRWKDSFENFLADVGPKPPGRSILKRIQTDGDYNKDNCKWVVSRNSSV